jgi:hypothetical protein
LKAYEALSRQVSLNVLADYLATRYRLQGKLKSSRLSDLHLSLQMSISFNGSQLTSQYDKCLRFHIKGYRHHHYIQVRNKLSAKVWEEVDFDFFGAHFCRLQQTRQVQHLKFVYNQMPLG